MAPVPNSETARRLSSSLNADTVTPGAPDEIIGECVVILFVLTIKQAGIILLEYGNNLHGVQCIM